LTSNDEHLRRWKNLREDIVSLPIDEQLIEIAKFCATIPNGARSVDYYNPTDWPTPWEIFFHGAFCRSSISLIIFYTLMLLNTKENVELWIVKDNERDYLLPVINNEFILNYEHGKVSKYSEVCDYFIIMQKIMHNQIKSIK